GCPTGNQPRQVPQHRPGARPPREGIVMRWFVFVLAITAVGCNKSNPNEGSHCSCPAGQACDANGQCAQAWTTSADCNRGNPCGQSVCANGACVATVTDGLLCDDGIGCTTSDHCSGGVCAGTINQAACDDSNPCTDDACSPTLDCQHTNRTGS